MVCYSMQVGRKTSIPSPPLLRPLQQQVSARDVITALLPADANIMAHVSSFIFFLGAI
jgi:hypothetical protein